MPLLKNNVLVADTWINAEAEGDLPTSGDVIVPFGRLLKEWGELSARTGKLFTSRGELNIKNARHAEDDRPPDPDCACPTCAHYSRGTLRHLYVAREATSVVLLTVHNLSFFLNLMRGAREAIIAGRYSRFRTRVELARRAEGEEDASAETEG